MRRRLSLPSALALLLVLAASLPAAADFRVRPAEILGCGSILGECRAFILEGTLEVAFSLPGGAGGSLAVHVFGSDLHLRSAAGGGASPFPHPEDLPLSELVPDPEDPLVLRSPDDAAQTVELRFSLLSRATMPGAMAFMLQGTYDEGCCDRFAYDLGTLLFEAHPSGQENTLFLHAGRFRVAVDWGDFAGGSGSGTPVKFDERSGSFWFFNAANPELLVKVLDGCTVNGHFWFFAAGLTNVEVEIRVTDIDGPATVTYANPLQQQFQPILDTTAFPCGGPST